MLFNSYQFLFLFLPITFFVFFLLGNTLKQKTAARIFLTLAALFFYGNWNWNYLILILGFIVFNFIIGTLLSRHRQFWLLIIGNTINLALLGYFKYTNFAVETLNKFHIPATWPEVMLPLAISFFTFQQIGFLVECYRGNIKKFTILDHAWLVTFFPHLIAGPIVQFNDVVPQFKDPNVTRINTKNIALGLAIFTLGLCKKVLIADHLSSWAGDLFNSPYSATFFDAWKGVLAYTFQIYFDFSGYSDMAVGLARLFNINLCINFNSPYKAVSIIDFWRRWHISLSRFLRDYLYFPLGGNKKGPIRRYVNLMIVMILGGLWHGAGWRFMIWGGLHGTFLCINHFWNDHIKKPIHPILAQLITFICVITAWVFFRALSVGHAIHVIKKMFLIDFSEFTLNNLLKYRFAFLILFLIYAATLKIPETIAFVDNKMKFKTISAIMIGLLFGLAILFIQGRSEFLYFKF